MVVAAVRAAGAFDRGDRPVAGALEQGRDIELEEGRRYSLLP